MFEQLPMAAADPILGLTEAFQRDDRPEKMNLGVGVYQDAQGRTPVLKAVKQAERWLAENESSKSYLGIAGHPQFDRQVQGLLWTGAPEAPDPRRMATLQTPGGTGGVRVAADFLRAQFPQARVWLSEPTWANHPGIFQAAGLATATYAYFDSKTNSLDFDRMLSDLEQAEAGDVVLLHACCHNPTGVDPDAQQWRRIGELLGRRRLLPLFDFAYQGFGDGLEEDAHGLHLVAQQVDELLVASSYSKNFGLYSERVGALTLVAANPEAAQAALSQLKLCVRTNYSNPPAHGASIVARILGDPQLRSLWQDELAEMRERIHEMRQALADGMARRAPQHDFSFLTRQRGMFSYTGLSSEQVDRLREQFAIYIVRSGRINVAGITPHNVDRLCDSIAEVLA
jgi:aspartate aminotransferase